MYQKFEIKYLLIMLLIWGLFGFTAHTFAQVTNDIYADVVPQNPAPGESVEIRLNSYLLSLDSLLITWYENGKKVSSGVGQKSFSLNASTAGTETTVAIVVASLEGDLEKRVVVKPSVMVILWEADDSYVPPFYRGKALLTSDSSVKIVAMPEIKTKNGYVNPKNMTYSWRKDYTNDQEASGYGKSYFIYTSDYLDPASYVEVSATTLDQSHTSASSINVATFQPKIVFYKNDETLGTLFENTLKNGHRIVDREIVFAAPYFISPRDLRIPRLDWYWYINDQRIVNDSFQKNILPLQVESGVSGASNVRLEVEHKDKLTQTVNGEIQFEF